MSSATLPNPCSPNHFPQRIGSWVIVFFWASDPTNCVDDSHVHTVNPSNALDWHYLGLFNSTCPHFHLTLGVHSHWHKFGLVITLNYFPSEIPNFIIFLSDPSFIFLLAAVLPSMHSSYCRRTAYRHSTFLPVNSLYPNLISTIPRQYSIISQSLYPLAALGPLLLALLWNPSQELYYSICFSG